MPKKVKFPIHITEVYQGIEADKKLDIGECFMPKEET